MPQPRRALGPLSSKPVRKELSPHKRAEIVGMQLAGATYSQINAALGTPMSTIRNTIIKSAEREKSASLPRSRRPKTYSDRDKRLILRTVRAQPRLSFTQVQEKSNTKLSKWTLRKILRENKIDGHVEAKKPPPPKGNEEVPATD